MSAGERPPLATASAVRSCASALQSLASVPPLGLRVGRLPCGTSCPEVPVSDAKGDRQRLSAIMAADGVAFSRLMAQDAESTVRALEAARGAFRAAVLSEGGRVIDTAGDSILAVFETASGALTAAVEAQRAVELLARQDLEDRRLRFRVGLHLGDVIQKSDGSIYGDGVNIAARLQALASPGGIVLSDGVRNLVRSQRTLLEDLGEQKVKNITEPVRAYRVVPIDSLVGFAAWRRRLRGGARLLNTRMSWFLPASLAAVIVVVGVDRIHPFISTTGRAMPASSPGEVGRDDIGALSVVVLPFANLTGDPQQAYVADGLTAAITADLGRVRDATIVSTSSAFAYKDKPVTVQQVGKELGVRFVLQGGVQRSGKALRVHAHLADATTGAQLWSESFEETQGDLFALQDRVTTRIGNSLGPTMLVVAVRDNPNRKRDPNVTDLVLRAEAATLKPDSAANYREIQALLRDALRIDPDNPAVLTRLAAAISSEAWNGYVEDSGKRESAFVEARDLALRAKRFGAEDPLIYSILSDVAIAHGDHDEGIRLAEKAVSLDPKRAARYINLANAYSSDGQPARALEVLKRGLPLSEKSVLEYFFAGIGVNYFAVGNDNAAIEWSQKAVDINAGNVSALVTLALAYARKGDVRRSRATVMEVLRHDPQIRPLGSGPFSTREQMRPAARAYFDSQFLPAWRKAGLPE